MAQVDADKKIEEQTITNSEGLKFLTLRKAHVIHNAQLAAKTYTMSMGKIVCHWPLSNDSFPKSRIYLLTGQYPDNTLKNRETMTVSG